MKATLLDGQVLEGDLINMCTGYVAKKIELEERDVRQLQSLLEHDPYNLSVVLNQLLARYPVNRLPLSTIPDCKLCTHHLEWYLDGPPAKCRGCVGRHPDHTENHFEEKENAL